MKVDAVEQRARHARLIIGGAARRAAAGERGIAEMAAAARVHRRDQLDPRREGHVGVGAGDADAAGLERLAKRIEHRALEFGKLVEEQDAEVREADLARADAQAAADQRRHRRAVVRRPERPPAPDLAAAELARDRGDHRHFERFGRLQRRQDARKAGGEQRLARARRAAHQQIVSAGGGDLERALGDFLALDLGEVGPAVGRLGLGRGRRRNQRGALEMREQRQQVGRGDDVELARPGALRCPAPPGRSAPCRATRHGARREARRATPRSARRGTAPHRDIMRQRLRVGRADRGQQAQARSAGRNASLPWAGRPATG